MAGKVRKKEEHKSTAQAYDVIVIGGGSAGVEAALAAAAEGASVCLVEADQLGGDCPHWACVPTKVMLHAAQSYYQAKFAMGRYGIKVKHVRFDFAQLMRRKEAVVETISSGKKAISKLLASRHVTVLVGQAAVFTGKYTLAVGQSRLRAKTFVIATGSRDVVPPIGGLDRVTPLFSRDVVSMKSLSRSVAIIGGGPVGVEFATFFSLLGVSVTIIEVGEHLLPREDEEIALLAGQALADRGTAVHLRTKLLSVDKQGKHIRCTIQTGKKPRTSFVVDKLMLAVGRKPNVDTLLLKKVGEDLGHIFYAGDAAGGPQFTAVASAQGGVAGTNAARLASRKRGDIEFSPRALPRVTFASPEIASVGMTAKEAVAAGYQIRVAHGELGRLGRSVIAGKRQGLLKIVVDAESNLILGASLMGAHAGEAIHELALAIEAEVPYPTVAGMLHAYPTYSEGIPLALGELL